MPGRRTVFKWLEVHKAFQHQYARAREAQADALADEILDIADESDNDIVTDGEGNERTNHEAIARSRLRVDARKWLAGKLRPKVYGDKAEPIEADDEVPTSVKVSVKDASRQAKS